MRPLEIEMTNFGPYAHQKIDFTKFAEQPFFLISGKTGSGKTTIFDAMCFALYGSTSGDDREASAMRSGFAKDSEKTEVQFIFEHQNKIYKIMRQPKQIITKKRGTGTKVQNMVVTLKYQEIDGTEMELNKVSVVNNFIQGLIHLTLEQFTQIIMLPQGKFRNFLDSDSNEKEKLLRELFTTSLFKKWTDEIQNRAKKTHDKTQEKQHKIDVLKSQVTEIDDQIDIVSWIRTADELIKKIGEEQHLSSLKVKESEKKIEDAQNLLEQNRLLQRDLKTLTEVENKIAEIKDDEWLRNVQGKLNQLKWYQTHGPLVVSIIDQTKNLKETNIKLEIANKEKQIIKQNAATIKEQLHALNTKETEIEKLGDVVKDLNRKKDYMKRIEKLDNKLLEFRNEDKLNTVKSTKISKELKVITKEVERQTKIVDEDSEIAKQELRLQKSESKLNEADKIRNAVAKQYERVTELRNVLKNQNTTLESQMHQMLLAKEKYEKLDAQLAKNQIIILSKRLKPGEPCPLCGALEHPKSEMAAEIINEITEKDVEDAANEQKKLAVSVGKISGEITINKERLTELRTDISNETAKLMVVMDFREDDFLSIQKEIDVEKKKLKLFSDELEEKKQKINEARKEIVLLNDRKNKSENEIELFSENERILRLSIAKLETELNTLRKELPEEINTIMQLEDLIAQKQAIITEFQTKQTKMNEELTRVNSNFTTLVERVDGLNEAQQILKTKRQANTEKLKIIMKKHDENLTFELMQVGLKQTKEIELLEEKIGNYQNEMVKLTTRVADLKKRTEGKNFIDIKELEEKVVKLKQQKQFLFDEYSEKTQKYNEITKVAATVKKTWDEYKDELKIDAQWNQLLEVIGGKGKVKLGLERYVLRRYLKQVLVVANLRLSNLTNDRYYFEIDQSNGTYATDTGLELDVFDGDLGKSRSVKTLSGGESFIAALCLALAMSEVIQSINGGTQIDALFIDEGFGSLDDESLQVALEALQTLEGKNRLIGIISHVSALREQLPAQLRIKSKNGRSSAHYVFDFEEMVGQ